MKNEENTETDRPSTEELQAQQNTHQEKVAANISLINRLSEELQEALDAKSAVDDKLAELKKQETEKRLQEISEQGNALTAQLEDLYEERCSLLGVPVEGKDLFKKAAADCCGSSFDSSENPTNEIVSLLSELIKTRSPRVMVHKI